MRKIFQWLVYSSANPQLISLTLKGFIPLLLLLGIDATAGQELTDVLSQSILAIGLVATSLTTLYGLVRKILLTFK